MKAINKHSIKQEEIDRSLLILTDTMVRLRDYLNVNSADTSSDLFLKISNAHKEVDEITNEIRLLFQECLERCINKKEIEIPKPSLCWTKDENGNISPKYDRYALALKRFKTSCEICGELRNVDKCHIIPYNIGGGIIGGSKTLREGQKETNFIYLCPSHHRYFDRGVLTEKEWKSIDWRGRSKLVKSYTFEVLLRRQQDYWQNKKTVGDLSYYSHKYLNNWIQKNLEYDNISELRRRIKRIKKPR